MDLMYLQLPVKELTIACLETDAYSSYYVLSTCHMFSHLSVGTHDVLSVATILARNRFTLYTMYSDHSTASGALFSFVFIADSGDVDFSRSSLLALDRNTSHNHTLPYDLYPGQYRVYTLL